MAFYLVSELSENLEKVLEEMRNHKEVIIQDTDGKLYSLKMLSKSAPSASPFLDLGFSRDEIVAFVRESRERTQG